MKKQITLILLALIACFFFMPIASAITVYDYPFYYYDGNYQVIDELHPSASGHSGTSTQSFTANFTSIESVSFTLMRTGTITFVLQAQVWQNENNKLDNIPDVALSIGISNNTLNTADLSLTIWQERVFTFNPPLELDSTYNYTIGLVSISGTESGGDVFMAAFAPRLLGVAGLFAFTAWMNSTARTIILTIDDGDIAPTPTPTPTITPTPIPAPLSEWLDGTGQIAELLIPLIIPLAVIVLLGLLCYKFAGPWGFFAGLNLGIILCYSFGLIYLWAVVLIAIIDVSILVIGLRGESKEEEG